MAAATLEDRAVAVIKMRHHIKIGEKETAKIVELYATHKMTIKAIAERFGVQSPAIARILRAQKEKRAE